MEAYLWVNLGHAQFEARKIEARRGHVSADFQSSVAQILEHAVEEGLIAEPECGGLEMREKVPSTLVQSMHITPQGITVETVPDCEAVPPVPEEFEGAVDDMWTESFAEYGTYCAVSEESPSEGLGRTMACAQVQEFDESRTITYPSLEDYEIPQWFAEGETDCGSDEVCRIIDLQLWPVSPGTGEGDTFEISCEEYPHLCELSVDLIDPWQLVANDEELTPLDDADEECQALIEQYNAGDAACSGEVAKCALGGNCSSADGDGHMACTHDVIFKQVTCSYCAETNTDGSCKTALVTTEKSEEEDPDNLFDRYQVDEGYKAGERGRGEPDTDIVGGDYDPRTKKWTPYDSYRCNIVHSESQGDHWKYWVKCGPG